MSEWPLRLVVIVPSTGLTGPAARAAIHFTSPAIARLAGAQSAPASLCAGCGRAA
ncbi:hypothetical protein [Kibdelosporangium aridum]|uniref:hypothetical protein n=1 Tax=Kibdelosporangium aridum TaxID=2030 RepID=UPI001357CAE7|nr:hypothetical protein [Kibdelosporangium aridum]